MSVDLSPIEWPTGTLLKRRAIFVYEGARLQAASVNAPVVPEPWSMRDETFRSQFFEIIDKMCGPDRYTDAEEAHNSWWDKYREMGWTYGPKRDPLPRPIPTWSRSPSWNGPNGSRMPCSSRCARWHASGSLMRTRAI